MTFWEKTKTWFKRNKKILIISGTVMLTVVGSSVGYALYKNSKISFPNWLKMASKEELEEAYEQLRLNFCKTGLRTYEMEQIGHELGERGAKEWFEKHPPNLDPNFRWTDANRWDKD